MSAFVRLNPYHPLAPYVVHALVPASAREFVDIVGGLEQQNQPVDYASTYPDAVGELGIPAIQMEEATSLGQMTYFTGLDDRIPGSSTYLSFELHMKSTAVSGAGISGSMNRTSPHPNYRFGLGHTKFSGSRYFFKSAYLAEATAYPALEWHTHGFQYDGSAAAADRLRAYRSGNAITSLTGTADATLTTQMSRVYLGETWGTDAPGSGVLAYYISLVDLVLTDLELEEYTRDIATLPELFRGPRVYIKAPAPSGMVVDVNPVTLTLTTAAATIERPQAIWYVHAPDGGGVGAGTVADPWNGWANINWVDIQSGDIIDLNGETHVGAGPLLFEKPVEVRNGVIDANGQASGFALHFRNSVGQPIYPIILRDLTIQNGNAGIQTYAGTLTTNQTTATNNQILNCIVKDMTTSHGLDHRGSGLTVQNCHFENIGIDCIRAEGRNITIVDNVFENYSVFNAEGDAIQFTNYAAGSVIARNYVQHEHADKQGILIAVEQELTAAYDVFDNVVVCTFVTPAVGQSGIRPGGAPTVHGNYISGFDVGMFCGTTSDGGVFTANLVHDCDSSALLIAGNNNLVANNVLSDAAIGIRMFAGTGHTVVNNWLEGNALGLELFDDADPHDYNVFSGNTADIENNTVAQPLAANEVTNSQALAPAPTAPTKPTVTALGTGGCTIDRSATVFPTYNDVSSLIGAGTFNASILDSNGIGLRPVSPDVGSQQFVKAVSLTLTAQPATIVYDVTVDVNPVNLVLTAASAQIEADRSIAVNPVALTLTVAPATIVLGTSIDVSPVNLTLTAAPATIVYDVTVDVAAQNLILTVAPATIQTANDVTVDVNSVALTLTTAPAAIEFGNVVVVNPVSLVLTVAAAVIDGVATESPVYLAKPWDRFARILTKTALARTVSHRRNGVLQSQFKALVRQTASEQGEIGNAEVTCSAATVGVTAVENGDTFTWSGAFNANAYTVIGRQFDGVSVIRFQLEPHINND